MYKINKIQGYIFIAQEHSQYSIIAKNRVLSLKFLNDYVVHLKLTLQFMYVSIKIKTTKRNSD